MEINQKFFWGLDCHFGCTEAILFNPLKGVRLDRNRDFVLQKGREFLLFRSCKIVHFRSEVH